MNFAEAAQAEKQRHREVLAWTEEITVAAGRAAPVPGSRDYDSYLGARGFYAEWNPDETDEDRAARLAL